LRNYSKKNIELEIRLVIVEQGFLVVEVQQAGLHNKPDCKINGDIPTNSKRLDDVNNNAFLDELYKKELIMKLSNIMEKRNLVK
ncbi:18915_t:CDS:2, partial [Funneliformis geosporum]